jgi:hypothetical protein
LLGSASVKNQARQEMGEPFAKKTSVTMRGRNSYAAFATTNQITNGNTTDAKRSMTQLRADNSFVQSIKDNHWDYGIKGAYKPHNHFQSVSSNYHNSKGCAMDVKPKIDQKQLNDLRKNHWPIGGPTASILETTSSKNLRPGTAMERV